MSRFGTAIPLRRVGFGAFFAANMVLLPLIGVSTVLDAGPLDAGYCVLSMEQVDFHVEHECTGLFALCIYLAAVAAYPVPVFRRLQGLLVGLPAFFAYSVLRLVILGGVAHLVPTWVQFSHLYLMVLMNLAFMLFLWSSWVNRVTAESQEE